MAICAVSNVTAACPGAVARTLAGAAWCRCRICTAARIALGGLSTSQFTPDAVSVVRSSDDLGADDHLLIGGTGAQARRAVSPRVTMRDRDPCAGPTVKRWTPAWPPSTAPRSSTNSPRDPRPAAGFSTKPR